jgi:hypothetical protein
MKQIKFFEHLQLQVTSFLGGGLEIKVYASVTRRILPY